MMDVFADRLLEQIEKKGAPICVGIDPIIELMPDAQVRNAARDGIEAAVDAIFDFTTRVLRIVAPHVPCVKFQSAYFEQYLWEGVEAYYSLIHEAAELGLIAIGDVKRGDIGSTSEAYAAAHLADETAGGREDAGLPDAITINPFCGLDSIVPFVNTAKASGKGLFVLVRTSNPGSAQLQDARLDDGRTWSEMLADSLRPITEQSGFVGRSGYSSIGAVVGATQAQSMKSLRQRLPRSIFLLPGYGTQGATAEMTRAGFIDGRGAIVSASRSILYAHRNPAYASSFGNNWEKCVEQAVLDMRSELRSVLHN